MKDQKRQTFKNSKGAKQTQYDIYMEDKAIIKQQAVDELIAEILAGKYINAT